MRYIKRSGTDQKKNKFYEGYETLLAWYEGMKQGTKVSIVRKLCYCLKKNRVGNVVLDVTLSVN